MPLEPHRRLVIPQAAADICRPASSKARAHCAIFPRSIPTSTASLTHIVLLCCSGNNEYNYLQSLSREIKRAMPYWTPHYVIDTSRNGRTNERSSCSNWCNIRGAGVGHLPTSNTSLPGVVDALFWLKTPGESDGCTAKLPNGTACATYDPVCGSPDAIGSAGGEPRAPVAGTFWDAYAQSLAKNADFTTMATTGVPSTPPVAFGGCADDRCPDGYECAMPLALCLPTEATATASIDNPVFATRLAHTSRLSVITA